MKKKLVHLVAAAACLAAAAPAAAQTPAQAKLSFSLDTGLPHGGRWYVIAGEPLAVHGVLRPLVAGQVVTFEVLHDGRRFERVKASVGARGIFKLTLYPRQGGTYTVRAAHRGNAAQAAASAKAQRFVALSGDPRAGGANVALLQDGLRRLGYVSSYSGRLDPYTSDGVLAFRKVNDMARTTVADRSVLVKLFRGEGGFRLRYPRAGRHVEFSWTHQVVVLADHGRAEKIYPASSGKPSTPTVFGTFRFYSKVAGVNSEGMYDSNYFVGGYAIHGYPDVPTYPASHGCIRVPNWEAPWIFGAIKLGETIFVYS